VKELNPDDALLFFEVGCLVPAEVTTIIFASQVHPIFINGG